MNARSHVVPTRADLRRKLESTTPPGQEVAVLRAAQAELCAAEEHLRRVRGRKIQISRELSVRRRKLHDWKGKIVRDRSAVPTTRRVDEGKMPCRKVAVFHGGQLRFLKGLERAMQGLEDFDMAWVIFLVAEGSGVRVEARNPSEGVVQRKDGWIVHIGLVELAEVQGRDVKADGLSVVDRDGKDVEVPVVDVKPYLRYCESWPDTTTLIDG